jgi:hypothetical protein
MPRNGAGSYSLPSPYPFTPGTTIFSADVNAVLADVASAMTGSIAADGQTVILNPLTVPDPTADGHAVNRGFLRNYVTGRQTIWVPAGAMRPRFSNGCTPLNQIEIAAAQPNIIASEFDPATAQFAQFGIRMPKNWNEGTITAAFVWCHPATTVNFGVVWSLAGVAIGSNETIGQAFGTAQQVTSTGGTTNNLYISNETPAITIGSTPAQTDHVAFQVSRVAADAADTLAVNARLIGVSLFYTTDAADDD